MSNHSATVEWLRAGAEFRYETYSREHSIDFGHGIRVAASAAPGNIPPSAQGAPGVDPEQAFVAALSSCHMLWFLHLACRAGLVVERYRDEADGALAKDAGGRMAMTQVTLRPVIRFSGTPPTPEAHARLHHAAHEKCFIANSVRSDVVIEPRIDETARA